MQKTLECLALLTVSWFHTELSRVILVVSVVGCRDGDVRLVGSRNSNEGRVEVCRLEQWNTICNNGWDEAEASVVCSQLGYSRRSKNC